MADTSNLTNFLNDVADAIRTKKETTEQIPAANFDSEILSIETGIDTSDATATADDITEGKTAYGPDGKMTGTIPELTPYTGVLTMDQNGMGSDGDGTIGYLNSSIDKDTIVRKGTNVSIMANNNMIANVIGLTADKIVKGNSFLGVEGTAETGSQINNQDKTITQNGQYTADSGYTGLGTVTVNVPSGSGDVKLFETEQAMQADPNPSEGDLAVVYREEIQPVTEESEFDSCTFPNTVVLDNAFSGDIYGEFRAVDHSVMFNGDVDMSSSRFRFDGWGESSQVRVEYTSQDGITYTRTDGGEELQEFGTVIKYEPMEPWNDVIGNFMKIGGNYFEGLFQYLNVDTNNQLTFNPSSLNISDTTINLVQAGPILNYEILKSAAKYLSQFYTDDEFQFDAYIDYENKVHIIYAKSGYNSFERMFIVNKSSPVIYMGTSGSTFTEHFDAIYDDIEKTFKNEQSIAFTTMFKNISSSGFNCVKINGYPICPIGIQQYNYDKWRHFNSTIYYLDTIDSSTNINITDSNLKLNEMITKYILVTTQLNATADDVYEKTFYGKNGVEVGTLQNKENLTKNMVKHRVNIWFNYNSGIICPSDASYMLGGCKNLTTIPLLDTSNVTKIDDMFNRCSELIELPLLDFSKVETAVRAFIDCTNLTEIPLFNTEKLKDMSSMFSNCKSLTTIPLLNTSKVTNMGSMFSRCTSLTTIPLLDTNNVTEMTWMFSNCTSLTTIPLLDTSNVTSMSYMFGDCTNLTTIPLLNTSKVTNMGSMFNGCTNLTTIPELDTSSTTNMSVMFSNCKSLTTIPLLNTSNITSMYYMFNGCKNLTTIPELNTSNVTNMYGAFNDCTSLSDESLNNILAMCKNATSYTSTKTLKYIGITSEQANKCKTLSNYSAFTSAGWKTGY